jgi:hypothetical protein
MVRLTRRKVREALQRASKRSRRGGVMRISKIGVVLGASFVASGSTWAARTIRCEVCVLDTVNRPDLFTVGDVCGQRCGDRPNCRSGIAEPAVSVAGASTAAGLAWA